MAALLLNMARHFEPARTSMDSLHVLIAHKIFRSPAYWEQRASTGHKCSGENVRTIIRNLVHAFE